MKWITPEEMRAARSPYRDLEHWLHYTDHLPAFNLLLDKPANLPGVGVKWPPNKLLYPKEG